MQAGGTTQRVGREDPGKWRGTYSVDQDDQVVGVNVTAGIISHGVVVADQGPVDGVDRKRQVGLL